MNITEAIQALKDGKQIRRCHWEDNKFYLELNKYNQIVGPKGEAVFIWAKSLTDDDWELYEPETEYFNCIEALKRLKEGKKIGNRSDGRYYFELHDEEVIAFNKNGTSVEPPFSYGNLFNKEWYEVE